MLLAVPHRHTHRGPFLAGELPSGLLAGLQNDALVEGATLALVGDGLPADRLARLAAAARRADLDPGERAEIRRWTRSPQHPAPDGVPATALVEGPSEAEPGRLPQRDFDLGRDLGLLPGGGAPPAATAVLLTAGDRRADWLRAGQALQRVLLHAASAWVFASLYTQPLENPLTRELIRDQLRLPGDPQMLLQFGRADTAASTPRRPPDDLMNQLRVQPLQMLGHPVVVMAADDAGRGGEHGRVRVGDRAGDARPGKQRQVVRHVAERDDLRGADAAGGRELGDRAGLAHPGRGGLDEPLAVGVRDADQAVEHRHGQCEQLVRAVAEVPGEQLGGRLAEQRAVTGARDGRVGVPADRLVHVIGGPPVRALDRDPDAGDRGAQRPRRRRELLRLDQVPRGDGAGPHVVLAALEPLRERAEEARQLADLAAGLGANQYRMTLSSFVLAARLEEVAKAASERLRTMTAGRFTLVHTDTRRGGGKAGLGLLACDAWTGVDRDTSTLSGGETFLASLALALGLADVVTAEAAGTPMEALFVDEGFGTLDEDTLDEVMNVLDGLRAGGRIVGIVSHVAELRQRIPAQVHVRKGHHGSHVTVTAG